MLFNSFTFIILFLPAVLVLFAAARRAGRTPAVGLLVVASLVFYSWTEPAWVLILVCSVIGNYFLARVIARTGSRILLALGVAADLGVLGFYKYTDFIIVNAAAVSGADFSPLGVVLPIGISFFTFQQAAFLADARRGDVKEWDFSSYCLFICFFPQLIAGPIVHHGEMMPQIAAAGGLRPRTADVQTGAVIFIIGLFKKCVIADTSAVFSTPVFDAALAGYEPSLFEAWGAALGYTLQIYFDFSGYSDMAVGLARMFGVRLPENFHSPYKARNIADFWNRWHMTLSRFLKRYLYIPLGGSRKGPARTLVNLMTVMILGGIWHGAGWGFLVWGALHGVYLCVHRVWAHTRPGGDNARAGAGAGAGTRFWAWPLTFICVVFAWVFFRAESLDAALAVAAGMAGLNGVALDAPLAAELGPAADIMLAAGARMQTETPFLFTGVSQVFWLVCALAVALFAPSTQQITADYDPVLKVYNGPGAHRPAPRFLMWRPSLPRAAAAAVMFVLAYQRVFTQQPFLYFQF